MQRKLCLFTILIAGLLLGCKKDIPGITAPDSYDSTNFSQIFQAYWTGMNNRYVFWSIDTVNWDRMYSIYQPKFSALQFNDPVARDSAHAYFTQMADGLIDSHYSLSFHDTGLHAISPAGMRKGNILSSLPLNYFLDSIPKYYFTSGYRGDSAYTQILAGQKSTLTIAVVTGLIQQHFLYFHLNHFYLLDELDSLHPYYLTNAWMYFLSHLKNPAGGLKGLIIDVRSNGGGNLDDMNFIVGQIISASGPFGYTRSKNGNGRLDYTPWAQATVTIDNTSAKYSGPVVVLTDQHSVSLSEQTALALKTLSHAYLIGDTTWGATGPLTTRYDLYDGGQFEFAHFGYVYTSSSMFKDINGKIYEGKGIPPDQFVRINPDSLSAGRDVQLASRY